MLQWHFEPGYQLQWHTPSQCQHLQPQGTMDSQYQSPQLCVKRKCIQGYIAAEVIFWVYCNILLQSLNCTQPTIQHNVQICRDILLSSSWMVTVVVCGLKLTALSPVVRDTVKDSVLSTTSSPMMGIIIVWFVLPLLNVRSVDTVECTYDVYSSM